MKVQRFINIVHFGPGNVGKEFVKLFFQQKKALEKLYQCSLYYQIAVSRQDWSYKSYKDIPYSAKNLIAYLKHPPYKGTTILVDTTASFDMLSYYNTVLRQGGWVVSSNKKNLTLSFSTYKKLLKTGHFYYETTVGAGLPVISTLQELLQTGDEIKEIQGCFSGTLGFIFSELEKGVPFSKAVKEAKQKGFTEPDPRDDLSGIDVARKALILARLIGVPVEMDTIKAKKLYPASMEKISVEEFMKNIIELDSQFAKIYKKARKSDNTYRYIATINKKGCRVGMSKVPAESDIGALRGPDNIVVIKTKKYYHNPMVIKGPGAGVQVTATGVLGDVIKILKRR